MSKGEGPSARELATFIHSWVCGCRRGSEHETWAITLITEKIDSFLVSHSQPLGSQQFTDGADSPGSLPTTTESPQWISLSERLPEPNKRVLWATTCIGVVAFVAPLDTETDAQRPWVEGKFVTHWQEIQPPAENAVIAGKGPLSSKDGQETVEQKGSHSQPAPLCKHCNVPIKFFKHLDGADRYFHVRQVDGSFYCARTPGDTQMAEPVEKGSHRGMPEETKK